MTTDVEGAIAFYESVFGWGHETHGGTGPGGYTEWKVAGRSVGGLMAKPPDVPAEVPPHWMVCFLVTDTDATVARITELGGQIFMPPRDIEPGRFAVAADPTGASFAVIALTQPPAGAH
jgi:predicted enzyme related to lactoylglutathione lyase